MLAELVAGQLKRRSAAVPTRDSLVQLCALFKERCATTVALADWAVAIQQRHFQEVLDASVLLAGDEDPEEVEA